MNQGVIMRSILSLLVVLVIAFGMFFLYTKKMSPGGRSDSPSESISSTGIKTDLLSIAQAERIFYAQNGRYAPLPELTSSGALTIPRNGRDGYTYSVETSDAGFTVTARFTPSDGASSAPRRPKLVIDQSMEIREAN